MRWRQVVALWIVALSLGVEYLVVERPRRAAPPAERAARARVFGAETADVDEVRVHRGGREVVARRAADGWRVVAPANASVPGDLLKAFLAALLEAEQIERVTTTAGDLAPFGLDERATRVEIRRGAAVPGVLFVGETNPTGTAVYARRDGSPEVILIGRTIQYYQEMLFDALPTPVAPGDMGPIASPAPLTFLATRV